jgi:hypothetical protein
MPSVSVMDVDKMAGVAMVTVKVFPVKPKEASQ